MAGPERREWGEIFEELASRTGGGIRTLIIDAVIGNDKAMNYANKRTERKKRTRPSRISLRIVMIPLSIQSHTRLSDRSV